MAILGLFITCRECDEFIVSYLDGTLSSRQQFLFNTHMKLCRVCHEYLEHYKQTIEIAKNAYVKSEAPKDMPDELVQAILAAKRGAQSDQSNNPQA